MGNVVPMVCCLSPEFPPPAEDLKPVASTRDNLLFNPKDIKLCYDLGTVLGEGSFGSVIRAFPKSVDSPRERNSLMNARAVKVISKGDEAAGLASIEIDIMSGLQHPNVVTLYEAFEDEACVYMVMELCAGGDLFDALVSSNVAEPQAVHVMQQVLRSAAYCHGLDIAHRDIKGENFLIQNSAPLDEAILKLADFGTSRRYSEDEPMTTALGTPLYIAPEVLRKCYTSKCDIWSCGVMLYIMLSGTAPFMGETDSETFKQVVREPLVFPPEVWTGTSSQAIMLIKRMLTRRVEDRYTALEGLRDPWLAQDRSKTFQEQRSLGTASKLHSRLAAFCSHSMLKKMCLEVVARKVDEAHIGELRDIFLSLDEAGTGVVQRSNLQNALRHVGEEEVSDILDSIVGDADGKIEYREFLAATMDAKYYHREEVIRDVFKAFDSGRGAIDAQSLQRVLDSGALKTGNASPGVAAHERSALNAAAVLAELGKSPTESISFEEFQDLMRNEWNQKDKVKQALMRASQTDCSDTGDVDCPLVIGARSLRNMRGSALAVRNVRSNMMLRNSSAASAGHAESQAHMLEEELELERRSHRMHVKLDAWEESVDGTWRRKSRIPSLLRKVRKGR